MSVNQGVKNHAKQILRAQRELLTNLVEVRKARGMTQLDVAEAMGVSQSAVAQFEHYDANPTLGTIRRYALAVGADVELKASLRADSPIAEMA